MWVTKRRKTFAVICPVSVLMCWCAYPQMGLASCIHCTLTHHEQLSSVAIPLPVPGHRSLRKRKGQHWQWLRLGTPTLRRWHTGFLLFFLVPGTPSSFAGRTRLQEVVAGTLSHLLADLSRDRVAGPDGMCSWGKENLSRARGPLWGETLGHLACPSSHSGYPHISASSWSPESWMRAADECPCKNNSEPVPRGTGS